jgi:fatty-acyl-CoA synthase
MEGAMQYWPLTVSAVVEYAARWHPQQEIISKSVEGPITISTYEDLLRRSKLCALALQRLGMR